MVVDLPRIPLSVIGKAENGRKSHVRNHNNNNNNNNNDHHNQNNSNRRSSMTLQLQGRLDHNCNSGNATNNNHHSNSNSNCAIHQLPTESVKLTPTANHPILLPPSTMKTTFTKFHIFQWKS